MKYHALLAIGRDVLPKDFAEVNCQQPNVAGSLVAAIAILKLNDIVLSRIRARLYFDYLKRYLAKVF